MSFKGVVKGGSVVFEHPVSLPEGTPVLVTIRGGAVGSPHTVLAAMAEAPRIGDEAVAALLREIDCDWRRIEFGSPLD